MTLNIDSMENTTEYNELKKETHLQKRIERLSMKRIKSFGEHWKKVYGEQ